MKPILIFIASLAIAYVSLGCAQASDSNMKFSGTLVSDPCELDPQTSDLTVDFKSVIEKDIYLYTRSASVPFTISLTGCDTTLGNSVTFTFKGTQNTALPGYLAVTGTAAGIAVGLETAQGVPVPLNQATSALTLANGSNSFIFKAYVTGEPEAMEKQSITPGDFSATATFEMAYP